MINCSDDHKYLKEFNGVQLSIHKEFNEEDSTESFKSICSINIFFMRYRYAITYISHVSKGHLNGLDYRLP